MMDPNKFFAPYLVHLPSGQLSPETLHHHGVLESLQLPEVVRQAINDYQQLAGKDIDSITAFHIHIRMILGLNFSFEESCAIIESITPIDDDRLETLKRNTSGVISLRGSCVLHALLYSVVDDVWLDVGQDVPGRIDQPHPTQRATYLSLAKALAGTSSSATVLNPLRPKLKRTGSQLQYSGEVIIGFVMLGTCLYYDYASTSVPPLLETWEPWLRARQTGDRKAFEASDYTLPTAGTLDARQELGCSRHRPAVVFLMRSLYQRARIIRDLDLETFRDIMAFNAGLPLIDLKHSDNRDFLAFVQVPSQLPAMLADPSSEAHDIWSGWPIFKFGRLDMYVRQVKHQLFCHGEARDLTILCAFLYSITSARHNYGLRGILGDLESQDRRIQCCPASFCGTDCPPCAKDRPLADFDVKDITILEKNPIYLCLEAVCRGDLDAKEWQDNIDAKLKGMAEWAKGHTPDMMPFDAVLACKQVAPMSMRIMSRLACLIEETHKASSSQSLTTPQYMEIPGRNATAVVSPGVGLRA